jgi:hypothetical protein
MSESDTLASRLSALEGKVQELETMVNLAMRLISLEKPVATLLERYGATEAEEEAIHALLGDLSKRADMGGMYAPSFTAFENELYSRLPAMRNNREFVTILLDTLKLDRAAYRGLHEYAIKNGWPSWD